MRIRNLLAFALAATLFPGCGGKPTPTTSTPEMKAATEVSEAQAPAKAEVKPKSKGVLALSVLTLTNPFFIDLSNSFKAEAEKNGYEAVIVSGEFDVAKQQNQVKDFIVKKVAAIALCPCDSKAIGPSINEAADAGIPVFTADIACLAPGAKVVSHVATDNLGGGRLAAKAMAEALGEEGGKVVILDYKEVESCILRVRGFKAELEIHNKDREKGQIETVAELPGKGVKDKGYQAAEDALQAHPDIVGIFAINDPSALGAVAALEKAGKADQIKVIGFDGQPEGKQAIKDGKIHADPIQFPDRIGAETVRAILRHFQGEDVPKELLIPTELYRKADADKDPTLKRNVQ